MNISKKLLYLYEEMRKPPIFPQHFQCHNSRCFCGCVVYSATLVVHNHWFVDSNPPSKYTHIFKIKKCMLVHWSKDVSGIQSIYLVYKCSPLVLLPRQCLLSEEWVMLRQSMKYKVWDWIVKPTKYFVDAPLKVILWVPSPWFFLFRAVQSSDSCCPPHARGLPMLPEPSGLTLIVYCGQGIRSPLRAPW